VTGIFLLHAFKNVNFSLADLPKFSKNGGNASVDASAHYSPVRQQRKEERLELLDNAEQGIGVYSDEDDASNTVLFNKKQINPLPNGRIHR